MGWEGAEGHLGVDEWAEMRFRIDISLSIGKDEEQEERVVDHTGYLADAGQTVGFARPEDEDE